MGLQVTNRPTAAMKINNEGSFGRAVIHPRCYWTLWKGELKRTRIHFGEIGIFPGESVQTPVVPAECGDLETIQAFFHCI